MKLTDDTLCILQNFASIQPNIVVEHEALQLKTVSEARNIMALADIEESFPCDFGIYDLNEFLSAIRLIDNPIFTFNDKRKIEVLSSKGTAGLDYFCSNPEILTHPKNSINEPKYEIKLTLSEEDLSAIKKAAGVLNCEIVSLINEDGEIWAIVSEPNNNTSNAYRIKITKGDFADFPDFNFDLLISNLKILTGSYTLELSSKQLSKWTFQSKTKNIIYWIALESTSSYNK